MTSPTGQVQVKSVSWERIGEQLLAQGLKLTALELYAELLEKGYELHRLRDYFTNPGHFEPRAGGEPQCETLSPGLVMGLSVGSVDVDYLQRSSSLQTFDSLDLARNSDDGVERVAEERIAVLEFQLRKASETIKSLRANLTVATESTVSLSQPMADVRGNIPKSLSEPLDLDNNTGLHSQGDHNSILEHCPDIDGLMKPYEKKALNFLTNEYLMRNNYKLTSITFSDENEDFCEFWDDVGLNISKPPDLLQLYRFYWFCFYSNNWRKSYFGSDGAPVKHITVDSGSQTEPVNVTVTVTGTDPTLDSMRAPETIKGSHDSFSQTDDVNVHDLEGRADNGKKIIEQMAESKLSQFPGSVASTSTEPLPELIYSPWQEMLLKSTDCGNEQLASGVSSSYFAIDSPDEIILLLAECLPLIIPNVIISKRSDVIPLILSTIAFHPELKERDKLLNVLFNLIRRPTDEQRHLILSAFVALARKVGCRRVESELLPQAWEQISHKYPERRILVAKSCAILAPFVSSQMRSSLLLSISTQIITHDTDIEVKEVAFRSLAILVSILAEEEDGDKFASILSLFLNTMADNSKEMEESDQLNKLRETQINILLPSLAYWALKVKAINGLLAESLLKKLEDLLSQDFISFSCLKTTLKCLQTVVPFMLVMAIVSMPTLSEDDEERSVERSVADSSLRLSLRGVASHSKLLSLSLLTNQRSLDRYDTYTGKDWYKTWDTLEWIVDKSWLPRLLEAVPKIALHYEVVRDLINVFKCFCTAFGVNIMRQKVKPLFRKHFKNYDTKEEGMAYINCVLPLYVVGVLTSIKPIAEEEIKEVVTVLMDALATVSILNASTASLEATVWLLVNDNCELELHYMQPINLLLLFLRDTVSHSNPFVRKNAAHLFRRLLDAASARQKTSAVLCLKAASASASASANASESVSLRDSDSCLTASVLPSLISLASDADIEVRASIIPAFGSALVLIKNCKLRQGLEKNIEIVDKIHFQLQIFLEDPMNRDQHVIQLELIRVFARVANSVNAEEASSCFANRFVEYSLPRLAALAVQSRNSSTSKTKKQDIVIALIEAYSGFSKVSFTLITEQLVSSTILPSLRCTRDEAKEVAPDYEETVALLLGDFERRVSVTPSSSPGSFPGHQHRRPSTLSDAGREVTSASGHTSPALLTVVSPSSTFASNFANSAMVDDMKNRMNVAKNSLTNIFQSKKK